MTESGVPTFPSMKASKLLAILRGKLGYKVVSQKGSHRKMRSDGRGLLVFAFHDGVEIPPHLVKKILTVDVGLDEDEAMRIVGMKG